MAIDLKKEVTGPLSRREFDRVRVVAPLEVRGCGCGSAPRDLLSEARRSAPERLRTTLRQPVERGEC